MKSCRWAWIIMMALPFSLLSQNLVLEYLGELQNAIEVEHKSRADSLMQLLPTFFSAGYTEYHDELALLSMRHFDFVSQDLPLAKILTLTRKKLAELQSLQGQDEQQLELLLRAVRNCRLHSAIDSMQQYLAQSRNRIEQLEKPSFHQSTYHYEFGRYAYLRHDFEGSLMQLRLGLDLIDTHFPDRFQTRLNFLNGIGIGLRRLGRTQDAIDHHLQTLDYIRSENAESPWVGNVLNNLGLCHSNLGQFEQAVEYQKAALRAYRKLGVAYQDQIATGLDNIGLSYLYQSRFDSAKSYSSQSLSYMQATFGENYADAILPTTSLARINRNAGNLFVADSFIMAGLELLGQFGWSMESPTGTFFPEDALTLFNVGMQIRQDIVISEKAHPVDVYDLSYARGLTATIDYAFYHLQSERSQTAFLESHRSKIANALKQYFAAYQHVPREEILMEALNAVEKYKSYQLSTLAFRDRISETQLFQELNEKHRKLLTKIRSAEEQLITHENGDSLIQNPFVQTVEKAKVDLQLWQEEIDIDYPQYVGIVREQEPISIQFLREKLLAPDQAMVSYFLDGDQVFIFTISHTKHGFDRVDAHHSVAGAVEAISDAITDVLKSGLGDEEHYFQNLTNYSRHALELYDVLLGHIEPYAVERLFIVPDGDLWNLPFDLLLSERPSDLQLCNNFPYVLRSHATAYSYSVYLWRELSVIEHPEMSGYRIMAPDFGSAPSTGNLRGPQLQNLIYSSWEASHIAGLLKAKPILGADANVPAFFDKIGSQQIIHLSTHAKIDPQNNLHYLAFSGKEQNFEPVTTTEIYGLHLQAELVTLSACESGAGHFEQGVGLISLARAFSYAGARSLISSLWPVSDRSTSLIMANLYTNLVAGQPKDLALQNAKLNYIATTDHLGAHPFLWAGLVAIGVSDPVFTSVSDRNLSLIFFCFILVLISGLYLRFQYFTGRSSSKK